MVLAGILNDVVDKLSGTSSRALKSQAVKDKLISLGRDIFHTTPAEADAYIKAAVTKCG
jgi:tripartite-type tricarboxylate transporter receptor subunit TctC